jgi:glycosyltransferase involved in cell wall biosynthesis
MKVVIDVSQVVYGTGVSDYTYELVSNLAENELKNQLVLFGGSLRMGKVITKMFLPFKDNVDYRIYPFPPVLIDLVWNKLHTCSIDRLVGKVDIYHSSDWAQSPSKAKKVTTVHDLSPFLFPQEMKSGGMRDIRRVHTRRMQWVKNECDRIICVSKNTASDLHKIFDIEEERIQVIPESVPSRFKIEPSQEDIDHLKRKYSLKNYIVTIGSIQPRKNIRRLISSFLSRKNRPSFPQQLVIVGRAGWGKEEFPEDKSIIFTGYLNDYDLVSLLKGAEVFAYPSIYEGFGLPVLIAFYHKIPVVTSKVSSLPEIAGDSAVLVDPHNEEDIAKGIEEALEKRQSLIKKGERRVNQFSWSEIANLTYELYRSL